MTELLQKAFDEVSKLPPEQQDAVAARLLEELADERRWDEAFAGSQAQLGKLAEQVRRDIQNGKTRRIGIDEL